MALSTNQKSNRVFRLLRGMSSAPALAILAPRGCTPEVLAEGWDLLRKANNIRLVKTRELGLQPATDDLSALQASWFPVADATLEARFPAVLEQLDRLARAEFFYDLSGFCGLRSGRVRRLARGLSGGGSTWFLHDPSV